MKDFLEKIRLIFLPFFAVAISFILIYTFLHWLLFIKFEVFSVKEIFLKFWLPFLLPWLPIYFILIPRLKILKFKDDNKSFGFQFLAVLIVAIPTIIAQEYLATATGKLTKLKTIYEFEKKETTKYYTLRKFHIDKTNIGVFKTSDVSGKNSEHFNMLIYVAMPIFENTKDTSKTECKYWLGKRYSKEISNHFSIDEKKTKYHEFEQEVEAEFVKTNFNDFTYLELIGNTDDHENFNDAINENKKYDFNEPLVFETRKDSFRNRNGEKLSWFLGTLTGGFLVWLIILSFIKFQPKSKKNKTSISRKTSNLKGLISFLTPKEGFYITPILLNLNIIIFLIMLFAGFSHGFLSIKSKYLLEYGANYSPYIKEGQFWRLLTSTFLHGGILHLFNNMIGLWFIGMFLEPSLGRIKFLSAYIITGISASIASACWHPVTISVGASGAIFGLCGLFLALLVFKASPSNFSKIFLNLILGYVGINLVMGLLGAGVDNAAHIGGLVSGFLMGCIMSPQLREENEFDNE